MHKPGNEWHTERATLGGREEPPGRNSEKSGF